MPDAPKVTSELDEIVERVAGPAKAAMFKAMLTALSRTPALVPLEAFENLELAQCDCGCAGTDKAHERWCEWGSFAASDALVREGK